MFMVTVTAAYAIAKNWYPCEIQTVVDVSQHGSFPYFETSFKICEFQNRKKRM
jgi:hypothetical protein